MATIGTFTQADNGSFTGTIKTLTLNAKATLRPIDKESDKSPDDPSFPAPIYATLSETDTAGEYALIWSR